MELKTTIAHGKISITVEYGFGGAAHMAKIIINNDEYPGRISLDQEERDALVAALQSIPRGGLKND